MPSFDLLFDFDADNNRGVDDRGAVAFREFLKYGRYIKVFTCIFENESFGQILRIRKIRGKSGSGP